MPLQQLDLRPPTSDVTSQVVCGANGLTSGTYYSNHCRIVATWDVGGTLVRSGCSAVKIDTNRLATAGRCIYDNQLVRICGLCGSFTWLSLHMRLAPFAHSVRTHIHCQSACTADESKDRHPTLGP